MTQPVEPTVVVNDASCLIDLRKGQLLHALMMLPYRFLIPLPVRYSELLDFSEQDWAALDGGGLKTFDLPADRVTEAFGVKAIHPKLSANDCFCLVVSRCHDSSVLLTGDALLRRVAGDEGRRVHGVLWVIDELRVHTCCDDGLLIAALEIWRDDQSVFLPPREIENRLRAMR